MRALIATVAVVVVVAAVLAISAAVAAPVASLPPRGACRAAESTAATSRAQQDALVCLVNWARRSAGLAPVTPSTVLARAAGTKGRYVVRCDDFSHTPCGLAASAAVSASGYRFTMWGENLFFGTGELGTPRRAMEAWLASPPHRRTLLTRGFAHVGVALLRPPLLDGAGGVSLWVLELAQPRARR
jgi:uncharacterized protein YkwD